MTDRADLPCVEADAGVEAGSPLHLEGAPGTDVAEASYSLSSQFRGTLSVTACCRRDISGSIEVWRGPRYDSSDSPAARANPTTVARPAMSLAFSRASGIMESLNITSRAPAAKPSMPAVSAGPMPVDRT